MGGAICVSACTDVGLWDLLEGGGIGQGEGGTYDSVGSLFCKHQTSHYEGRSPLVLPRFRFVFFVAKR